MRRKNSPRDPLQVSSNAQGRCRLHGGLSTGAKTAEGIERIRRAVTRHGHYSKRAKVRAFLRACHETLAGLSRDDKVECEIP